MGSVCAEHKFYPSNQLLLKKSLREIDIPPRKLLSRRTTIVAPSIPPETTDMFLDSPKADHETLLQKFLPYNGSDDDDDDDDEDGDPYSSDEFRMFEFKVRRCTRSRSHDWTDCPFAHPGEKARRRDPRRYHYSGTICSEFRRGGCSRGDNCEFAHGVFECWLHPARYRTEACKDGKNCKRKVCFFAHTPRQLRVLPPHCDDNPNPSPVDSPVAGANRKYRNSSHCCFYCHSTVNASPTSTLMGMSHLSPPLSPPLSPVQPRSMSGFSPIYTGVDSCGLNPGVLSYKDAVTELMSNFEAMNMNEVSSHAAATNSRNIDLPWLEVSFNGDDQQQQQQQFILSPSTPITSSGFRDSLTGGKSFIDHDKLSDACPDLGWVNDLLT